jgi:anhydro-N-acetylmuramic acid kinase
VSLGEVCALDSLLGKAFADPAQSYPSIDLICSHGQTVFHWPAMGTLQIGQPAWIAERTGVPVVSDLRVRDMAAGGQGAPLVALLDSLLLASLPGRPAALNLGGIANITAGASAPRILGTITPGAGPLRLPEPLLEMPASLRLA